MLLETGEKVQNVPLALSVGSEMEGMTGLLPGILFFSRSFLHCVVR